MTRFMVSKYLQRIIYNQYYLNSNLKRGLGLAKYLSHLINLKVGAIKRKTSPHCCSTRYLFMTCFRSQSIDLKWNSLKMIIIKLLPKDNRTKSVPLTVWEHSSRTVLHERHSLSLHNSTHPSELHLFWGSWMEFAVSPKKTCNKYINKNF